MFDGSDTVLVVGAHPDDEVLGPGGAVAKHAAAGDEVHVLIVTEGTTQQYEDEDLIEQKRADALDCANILGVTDVHFGGLPDMRLDAVGHVEINTVIEDAVSVFDPDIVYTHSRREVNRDHVAVHDSTLVATRPESGVNTLLAYETPSSTDYAPDKEGFSADLFVDIGEHLEVKVEAFCEYDVERRPFPHPRSPESLRAMARSRGAASSVEAAEAFDVVRAYR